MTDLLDNLTSVEVMRLEPGDVIVASVDGRVDQQTAGWIKERLQERFPEHDVLIFAGGVKISLTREVSD